MKEGQTLRREAASWREKPLEEAGYEGGGPDLGPTEIEGATDLAAAIDRAGEAPPQATTDSMEEARTRLRDDVEVAREAGGAAGGRSPQQILNPSTADAASPLVAPFFQVCYLSSQLSFFFLNALCYYYYRCNINIFAIKIMMMNDLSIIICCT